MKNLKHSQRITALAAVAALTVTGLGILPETAIETKAASLTGQSATQITSQMTVGWNLGNTLECSNTNLKSTASPDKFATKWGNPVPTKETFDAVKAAGFNTVRIPTTWYEHLEWSESDQMYVINDSWMDYVKQTVDYAYSQDMFVILNMHHEDFINASVFTDETYNIAAKKMGDIWTQVSQEFKDYDQHLIFEGMNEPRQTGNPAVSEWGNGSGDNGYTWNYINNLNAVFVNTVRSQGSAENKERLLMLPGYCASSDFTSIREVKIPENAGNVALSVHAYLPYFFTMGDDEYSNHEFPGKSGYGEDYETSLSNFFSGLKQISTEKNAPIIIGEFSASNFDNTQSRVNWATSYMTKAKDAGIPCVLWDNMVEGNNGGEAHGYLYRLTNTWFENSAPVVKAMMDVYGISSELPAYKEYVAPPFSWENISVKDNWVELFRSEEGYNLQAWVPSTLTNWEKYVNRNYDIYMIYDSIGDPALVMQDSIHESWDYVFASGDASEKFIADFTYQDIQDGLRNSGTSLERVDNMYISATAQDVKVYGVYAVPKNNITPAPEPDRRGDVNYDGQVNIYDFIKLKKNIMNGVALDYQTASSDVNQDGQISVLDIIMLQKFLLGKINSFQ